jgi:FixJ family two-component response regulator
MTRMQHPTVYLVDDDPDMRDSLGWLMKTVGLRVESFASATEFLDAFDGSEGPGCLVFDVRMPGLGGIDLFEKLAARGETMPVIFITAFADVPMAIRAMRSGAIEFVEKPFNRQALLDKVQTAIHHDLDRRRTVANRDALFARFLGLTDREREVLELIKEGRPNKAIADHFGITSRAVEMRRAALMKRLGVRSLAELLKLAFSFEREYPATK